jgi:hypothetical protein
MSPVLSVLAVAYGLGLLAAMPIGAAQVEVIKRALACRYRAALSSAAGSVASDVGYGLVAVFATTRLGWSIEFGAPARWLAPAIAATVSWLTWRQAVRLATPGMPAAWSSPGASFLTGLSVSAAYPPIMLTWLAGLTFVRSMRLVDAWPPALVAAFVLAGGAGLFSYQALLTVVLRRTRHLRQEGSAGRALRGLSIALGAVALVMVAHNALQWSQAAWAGSR